MKKTRMNISHFHFILFNLKIFREIVTRPAKKKGLHFNHSQFIERSQKISVDYLENNKITTMVP